MVTTQWLFFTILVARIAGKQTPSAFPVAKADHRDYRRTRSQHPAACLGPDPNHFGGTNTVHMREIVWVVKMVA